MKTLIICIHHRANPGQPSCAARGSKEIAACLEDEIAKNQLAIRIEKFNCLGFCERGPNLKIAPEGRFIHDMSKADIPELISELTDLESK